METECRRGDVKSSKKGWFTTRISSLLSVFRLSECIQRLTATSKEFELAAVLFNDVFLLSVVASLSSRVSYSIL